MLHRARTPCLNGCPLQDEHRGRDLLWIPSPVDGFSHVSKNGSKVNEVVLPTLHLQDIKLIKISTHRAYGGYGKNKKNTLEFSEIPLVLHPESLVLHPESLVREIG